MIENMELHQYSFKYGEDVIYRRCEIVSVKCDYSHYGSRRSGIKYKPLGENTFYYVPWDDVDKRVASSGTAKIVVLSEPDYDKARRIVVDHIHDKIEAALSKIDDWEDEARRISCLELGDTEDDPWEEVVICPCCARIAETRC